MDMMDSMNKIPCYFVKDKNELNKIINELHLIGYNIISVNDNVNLFPIVLINYDGKFGNIGNGPLKSSLVGNRFIINDYNDFILYSTLLYKYR